MMKLITKNFGEIEYDENLVLDFDDGLPGFSSVKKFIVLTGSDDDIFCWLQAVENGDVAFALMNVYPVLPDYNPLVDKDELGDLGDLTDANLLVYNIVVIPEDLTQMRVNLKAPVIINPASQKGRQVILDNDEYSVKHYIFDDLKAKIDLNPV